MKSAVENHRRDSSEGPRSYDTFGGSDTALFDFFCLLVGPLPETNSLKTTNLQKSSLPFPSLLCLFKPFPVSNKNTPSVFILFKISM